MKFNTFFRYLKEAFSIYYQNISSILLITSIMCIVTIPAYLLYQTFTILQNSIVSICCITLFTMLLMLVSYTSLSIYAFYITFKSKDDTYKNFLHMLRDKLLPVMKISLIAWLRIALGLILLTIPSYVMYFRYAAMDYFVILDNANFTTARINSTKVMKGFKIILLMCFVIMALLLIISDILRAPHSIFTLDPESILENQKVLEQFSIWTIVVSMVGYQLHMLRYILTYIICKYEAPKLSDAPSK